MNLVEPNITNGVHNLLRAIQKYGRKSPHIVRDLLCTAFEQYATDEIEALNAANALLKVAGLD